MRFPNACYQMDQTLAQYFPRLRRAQRHGLVLWVYGTTLAQSTCETAVVATLLALGKWHTLRQRLREWLYDGADKAAPCTTQLEVQQCFAPLLGWVLAWWHRPELALALDATAHGEQLVVLALSVLYRSCALPVAWQVLPGNRPGAWMPHILQLLEQLRPAVPGTVPVLVLADRGLWSPRLWHAIQQLGWHPVLRVQDSSTFQPQGLARQRARTLVPGPGHAWVGRGVAFRAPALRQSGTLLVVWGPDQRDPWVVLTDLPPKSIGVCWYGLRVWIELGFRALKGVGFQWQQTRRTEPTRVARHWLVLAVAMVWVLAYGTRVEEAIQADLPPAQVYSPPPPTPRPRRRWVSVLRLGLSWLRLHLARGRLWHRLWLAPEPWPEVWPQLAVHYHDLIQQAAA
jgi:Transposase DDE domain